MIKLDTDLGPFVSLLLNSLLLNSLPVRLVYVESDRIGNCIPKNLINELGVVVLFGENVQELGHRFGKVLKVGEILDNRGLCP